MVTSILTQSAQADAIRSACGTLFSEVARNASTIRELAIAGHADGGQEALAIAVTAMQRFASIIGDLADRAAVVCGQGPCIMSSEEWFGTQQLSEAMAVLSAEVQQ